MVYSFAKSSMGYFHKTINKPCQDFSLNYQDKDKVIIACCDGHGGDVYIRSKVGSELASKAILNVFLEVKRPLLRKLKDEKVLSRIKLAILCEWNRLVEQHLSAHPIHKNELINLSDERKEELRHNPSKAYGTTLSGAMLFNGYLIIVNIGDTEAICIKKGKICKVFDDSDEPVANITYSMCQEDAYQHLHLKAMRLSEVDGIILCTDGLTSPYQSYDNFNESFVKPMMYKILGNNDVKFVDQFIENLASDLGIGDDVSLAYIINANAHKKSYK